MCRNYRKENNEEIARWVEQDRPKVWFKDYDGWLLLTETPIWCDDFKYIVDDKHVDIRKQLHDNPGLKVEMLAVYNGDWLSAASPRFQLASDYRIAPKAFKPFTLEVNTLEEAQELWHRLNTAYGTIKDNVSGCTTIPYPEDSTTFNMWNTIDNRMYYEC